jgi:hypothetical protein
MTTPNGTSSTTKRRRRSPGAYCDSSSGASWFLGLGALDRAVGVDYEGQVEQPGRAGPLHRHDRRDLMSARQVADRLERPFLRVLVGGRGRKVGAAIAGQEGLREADERHAPRGRLRPGLPDGGDSFRARRGYPRRRQPDAPGPGHDRWSPFPGCTPRHPHAAMLARSGRAPLCASAAIVGPSAWCARRSRRARRRTGRRSRGRRSRTAALTGPLPPRRAAKRPGAADRVRHGACQFHRGFTARAETQSRSGRPARRTPRRCGGRRRSLSARSSGRLVRAGSAPADRTKQQRREAGSLAPA